MIAMGTTPDGPALQALVSLALELDAEGQEVDTVELAGGDALLALRLAEALETARRLPGLFSVSTPAHGPGDRVLAGRYRVDGRLGSGAMGVVHQAFDQELLRPVAIKVLHAGLLDEEQARARFEREAEILASLHHPGVVTLHDRGETEDGEAFLVMELLTGCSLTEVLEQAHALQGRVEELDTRWIAAQLGLERLSEVSYLRACAAWAAELADGLGEGARLVLDEFVFDPRSNAGGVGVVIKKGAFRFVSGKIAKANPRNMRVLAGNTAIAVRGTEVIGTVGGGADGAGT